MKKLIALILSLGLLFQMGACAQRGGQNPASGAGVNFYYQTEQVEDMAFLQDGKAVVPETRTLEAVSLKELLGIYFDGPVSDDLVTPFPEGTRVLDMYTKGGKLVLKMSGEYFTLMGVELSVANYCLASTVCDYSNLESVAVMDSTETINLDIYPEHYVISNDVSEETDESFTVYFADAGSRFLIPETRDATLSENETEMAYVMRSLMEGPESPQAKQIIPEGTELLDISFSDGMCTLNFSSAFYDNRRDDTYGAYMTLYGITNTLTSLPDVMEVCFLVEGEPLSRYGIFSLEKPLTRNATAIGPLHTVGGEMDVNIYILSEEDGTVFAVPCRIKQSISQPLAEAVASAVLSFEAFSGFYNPIPYGTELLNVSVSGNVCYVDVSERFVPQEDTEEAERAAVWALVKSLTGLDGITYVVLTINGEPGGLNHVDISEPLSSTRVTLH